MTAPLSNPVEASTLRLPPPAPAPSTSCAEGIWLTSGATPIPGWIAEGACVEVGWSVKRLASRPYWARMRFAASSMAMTRSEWPVMSLSTRFISKGDPGSSLMNQAMATAAACQ